MMKVCNGYTNEFNKNYKKFQKTALLCWNRNIMISVAADESLGKYKAITQNEKLETWKDEIKLIVQQKYRGADKSLARPGRKQPTVTKL